jgi:hypothetical protein
MITTRNASFDLDGDLMGLQEARDLITAAIVAVMGDKRFAIG